MEEQNLNQEPNNEEQEPEIKLGKRKIGIVLVVFILVIVVILFIMKSCSVSKEIKGTEKKNNKQVEQVEQKKENEITSKADEEQEKIEEVEEIQEESGFLGGVEKETVEEKQSEIVKEEPKKEVSSTTPEEGSMVIVSDPSLGDVHETSAMVSSKSIFKVDGTSYAYTMDLVILKGNDDYSAVKYFCPRKTFDALSEGDSIKVSYQLDSNGVVSITSVSK